MVSGYRLDVARPTIWSISPQCRSIVYIVLLLIQSIPSVSSAYWPVVNFLNLSPIKLQLHFVDSGGQAKLLSEISPSAKVGQNTFVGHKFRVTAQDTSLAAVVVNVQHGGDVAITKEGSELKAKWTKVVPKEEKKTVSQDELSFAQEKVEECLEHLKAAVASGNDPNAVVEDSELFCLKFPQREVVISKQQVALEKWKKKMESGWRTLRTQWQTQPSSLRNFTASGFSIFRRHPKNKNEKPYGGLLSKEFVESMDTMTKWYEINRLRAKPEEHGIFDPSVSSYESDTWIVHPPADLKRSLTLGIKQGLERWAGLPEDSLKFIAFYGPRLYRNNSVLHRHVDIWETHVLSAIIAIGRRGLQRPWPIEILDHDGKLHSQQDYPGDVTFYESATCAHSREESPLLGREVANIFVHFKPKEGWAPLAGSELLSNKGKIRESAEL